MPGLCPFWGNSCKGGCRHFHVLYGHDSACTGFWSVKASCLRSFGKAVANTEIVQHAAVSWVNLSIMCKQLRPALRLAMRRRRTPAEPFAAAATWAFPYQRTGGRTDLRYPAKQCNTVCLSAVPAFLFGVVVLMDCVECFSGSVKR